MSSRFPSSTLPLATQDISGAHILVVDDRPNELQLLIEILRASRCRISVAFDGAQAYNRAQLLAPDLILMDLMLPDIDGFGVCEILHSCEPTAHIPVVMLTAWDSDEARALGQKVGTADYLSKPFKSKELIARVSQLVAVN